MEIAVLGLGYVGCVTAALLARDGHSVAGCDTSAAKVERASRGAPPVRERGLEPVFAEAVRAGRLRATTSLGEALGRAEVALVCVGTPSRPDGGVELSYLREVARGIGDVLRERDEPLTVAVRSTVPPGTARAVVLPIIEEASGKRLGRGFGLASHPEFLREGSAIADYERPPFTVVGSSDEASIDAVARVHAGIAAPLVRTSFEVAELMKYACNAFHAVKIAFANEVGSLARALGLDGREVMRVFCEDRKLNVSPAYLRPGFAFGGSCLPKDLRALASLGRTHGIALPLLGATLDANEAHIRRGIERVLASGARRIGLFGVCFKAGTDDLRESPMVRLARELIHAGCSVRIYDEALDPGALLGANRDFMAEELPELPSLLFDDPRALFDGSDLAILATAPLPASVLSALRAIAPYRRPVLDLVGALPAEEKEALAPGCVGLCW